MDTMTMLRGSWHSWWNRGDAPVGPAWLLYVWTFLFSAALAVGFTILGFVLYAGGESAWRNLEGWWQWYLKNLIVSECVGFTIHFAFNLAWWLLGNARIRAFGSVQRVFFFAGIPMLATALASPLGLWLAGADLRALIASNSSGNALVGSLLFSLLLTFIFYQFFAVKARQIKAERAATEARLKLLQAQIEPHFLFNTLANVVGLMDADLPRAKLMLESFIDYLRSSLGSLRRERHTLGDELALVEAYMRIIQIRMDDRLAYRIDVPEALRALPLPALTLQPLVENAIQHGLEPKIEGGSIQIGARIEAGRLVLSVFDDGLGLDAKTASRTQGSGTALKNIRERLAQSHGDAAHLQIARAQPQGVRATLTLPATNSSAP